MLALPSIHTHTEEVAQVAHSTTISHTHKHANATGAFSHTHRSAVQRRERQMDWCRFAFRYFGFCMCALHDVVACARYMFSGDTNNECMCTVQWCSLSHKPQATQTHSIHTVYKSMSIGLTCVEDQLWLQKYIPLNNVVFVCQLACT